MSELQKYIVGADNDRCPIIMPVNKNGWTGEWERFGAGLLYKADEVDRALATLMAHNAEYAKRHIEQLAQIELRDRCINWCLQSFAGRCFDGSILRGTPMNRKHELEVPVEFEAIIGGVKP